MTNSDRLQQANKAISAGKPNRAIKLLTPLVDDSAQGKKARIGLINALMQLQRYRDALPHFDHALGALPDHPGLTRGKTVALNRLGIAALNGNDLPQAQQLLEQALALLPDSPEALYNLALVHMKLKGFDQAAKLLDRLPGADTAAEVCLQRAKIARAKGQTGPAASWLTRGLSAARDPELMLLIGDEFIHLGDTQGAKSAFSKALAMAQDLDLDQGPAQLKLARIMIPQGDWSEPQRWLKALKQHPSHGQQARTQLIDMWVRAGDLEQAAGLADGLPVATVLKASLEVPPVAESSAQIHQLRQRVLDALERLLAGPALAMASLRELGWNNFYLSYHGQNNRQLKQLWGQIVRRQVEKLHPELLEPPPPRRAGRRRIGLLSSRWGNNVVGHYFGPWIGAFADAGWETLVYQVGRHGGDDMSRQLLGRGSQARALGGSVQSMVKAVRDDQLDLMVLPEMGNDTLLTPLAACRLAPLQLVGWGLPDTTGLATVDGFISVAAMEPEDCQQHYSERLLTLPGLGTAYAPPPAAAKMSRRDLGLPESKTLYLLPHSHCKIHPDLDPLLAAIMAADPDAMLVMFEGHEAHHWQVLSRRLERSFDQCGLDLASRVITLPAMPRQHYLAVNRCCNVLLDTHHFSGGNTSIDALSVGLPVVTLAGALMRGRQTSAMLQLAGLQQMVATSSQGYVELALSLAGGMVDRGQIETSAQSLFNQPEPLQELVSQLNQWHDSHRLG